MRAPGERAKFPQPGPSPQVMAEQKEGGMNLVKSHQTIEQTPRSYQDRQLYFLPQVFLYRGFPICLECSSLSPQISDTCVILYAVSLGPTSIKNLEMDLLIILILIFVTLFWTWPMANSLFGLLGNYLFNVSFPILLKASSRQIVFFFFHYVIPHI